MPGARRPTGTPPRITTALHLRPRRLALPARSRPAFLRAAAAGFLSYAVFGVYLSLAPAFSATLLHTRAPMVGAVVAALLLGSSATAQLVVPPTRSRVLVALGMTGLALGLGLVVVAAYAHLPALLFVGSVLGGACQGIAFRSLFTSAVAVLDPALRASQMSTLWVIVYLGSSAPVVAVGALARSYGLLPAVSGFALVTATACLALAGSVLRRR
jgi:hypothetical protein